MEEEIEYYKMHLSDLIPYDDPEYERKLENMAKSCMEIFDDPELQKLCEDHDKIIEDDLNF